MHQHFGSPDSSIKINELQRYVYELCFFQVIAENLSTAVVADLQTLVKSMKDDRRKVTTQQLRSFLKMGLIGKLQTPVLYTHTHASPFK